METIGQTTFASGIQVIKTRLLAVINEHHTFGNSRFTEAGTHKIVVTFVQPSSKLLPVEIKCATVTIVKGITQSDETCFKDQHLSLHSSKAMNNVTSTTPVLLLPFNLQHNLEPTISTGCSQSDLIYSFYLLSIDASQWKFGRAQRYPTPQGRSLQETFLPEYCAELGPKSTLTIEAKSLSHGYYLAVFTVSVSSNAADFRQFIQPVEIVRSDLQSKFRGNDTITSDGQFIELDFYSSTVDPDSQESDRRKLNLTLICYPERLAAAVFQPNTVQLGSSRPTDSNPQNHNPWSIQWSQLSLVTRRPELNIQFYENECFSAHAKQEKSNDLIQFDLKNKLFNISEEKLQLDNDTLHFLLIARHLTDGRQLITRFSVDKRTDLNFDTTDLNALDEVMNNLDNLALANPKKAVELVSGLADKLNGMSNDAVGRFSP